jgi:hypothetical protein
MDGEGDGGGELHAATEGRRKSAPRGCYHRSSEEWRRFDQFDQIAVKTGDHRHRGTVNWG